MQNKLTEIIRQSLVGLLPVNQINDIAPKVAERISKCVIALPDLKYRQEIYHVYKDRVIPLEVSSYRVLPEFGNLLQISLYKNGFNAICMEDEIGVTYFLNSEDAKKALKKETNL